MKRLFFIRHGETDLNVKQHFAGITEAQLTDDGRTQAQKSGRHLKSNPVAIDWIISSPLARTQETAKIIATEIGFPLENIELNELFLERNFGPLENTSAQKFLTTKDSYRKIDTVEGAETIANLQTRAERALQYVKSLPHDNVLVVSHGAFGRAFRRAVMELPHSHEYEAEFSIGNAEILELI